MKPLDLLTRAFRYACPATRPAGFDGENLLASHFREEVDSLPFAASGLGNGAGHPDERAMAVRLLDDDIARWGQPPWTGEAAP